MEKSKRIIGFDLARAYAIFGMYIVNFNIVFGNYSDTTWAGKLLSMFSGNSSSVFVILAGMGLALMTNRPSYTRDEQQKLKNTINKRAWFLFGSGLLLFLWWPADILHFYGAYMHLAAWGLFLDKKYYLYAAAAAVLIFHIMLVLIPYETAWDFETLAYQGFWTLSGFLRNTFYNGWNSVFPWIAYFAVGMYLGRLDWTSPKTQGKMFVIGLALYMAILVLQTAAHVLPMSEELKFYIQADYLPPFLPFVVGTTGFGLMLIAFFMYISQFLADHKWAHDLAKTGQMTLTHYVSHLTIGMISFALITGKEYTGQMNEGTPVHPMTVFMFSLVYFIGSYYFSKLWTQKYKNGPLEMLMRKISD